MSIDLKYIVTGTGRCGTLFVANLLTSMGIPCSHEAIFTPSGLSFAKEVLEGEKSLLNSEISKYQTDSLLNHKNVMAESSYMAAPFLDCFDCDVIHIVRNPFKVIGSFIGEKFNFFVDNKPSYNEKLPNNIIYENFIFNKLPELHNLDSQLDRACLYYIRWNQIIEQSNKVKLFVRIEDASKSLKNFFGFKGNCFNNKNCNSFKEHSCKWSFSQIKNPKLRKEMADIIKKYKYLIF